MKILGINAYHGDSSAAIVVDGRLVAAIEEERFNRVKHWAGFPAQAVRYCLSAAGVEASDLDHVAISFNPRANLGRRAKYALQCRPSIGSVVDRLRRLGRSMTVRDELAAACGTGSSALRAQFHQIEHHDAHIASGFFVSPFDSAAVLSVDGMGDFVSTVTATANGTGYEKLSEVFYPHSLGFLYNAVTIYLGFPNYGDEYKVMGLAPYGQPKYLDEFREIIRPQGRTFALNLDYFTHAKQGISMRWEGGNPHVAAFHSRRLEELLGPARDPREEITTHHENVAASLQRVTEEIIFHLLNELHAQTQQENLVMVGGCAMNSVANGKITRHTPFKNLYVPVGAADNGTAIGAAFDVWHRHLRRGRSFRLEHAFWGTEIDDDACQSAAEEANVPFQRLARAEMIEQVVSALVDGKIVGWFQGRMEFGARALGSRSLLADPRRADMREIINLKIKFRERFRPFAPSILAEYVSEYFEIDEPSPFMERVLPIRADKHAEIPAVTHVDGSGRLQTVTRDASPLYWELIDAFRRETGVPIILNTSLNENEPIVRTPAEAIRCFLRTSMDMLVLGNVVIDRAAISHDTLAQAHDESHRLSAQRG